MLILANVCDKEILRSCSIENNTISNFDAWMLFDLDHLTFCTSSYQNLFPYGLQLPNLGLNISQLKTCICISAMSSLKIRQSDFYVVIVHKSSISFAHLVLVLFFI